MTRTSPQLDYAPPTPVLLRKRLRQVLFWLLVGAIAGFLIAWMPHAVRRLQILSLQRKCLDFTAPPDRIVFDSRGTSLPQLQRSDPNIRIVPLTHGAGSAIGWMPRYWHEYYHRVSLSTLLSCAATVHMHRMRSPCGNERLVVVGVYWSQAPSPALELATIIIEPGTLTSVPRDVYTSWSGPRLALAADDRNVIVFAGQSDPEHADHFTINANADGKPLLIDGWLCDNDTVKLEPRAGEFLTPPARPSTASSR